ncbi:MAG: SMC-Scp complex subunit ScpB [Patescibacteria group bacterium]|nr:SMC-Scp complex subunit ScpB [Patescibacteria group bacterium]
MKNLVSAIEALFFIHGEPLDIKKISKILEIEEDKIKIAISELSESLKNPERGLDLIFQDGKIQLVTKPEFASIVENFIKEEFEENLTPAALETLSLIAYLGPISRSKIDYFRGVNSSYTVRNLIMRGLIEKSSDPAVSRVSYITSFDLLKHLGISKTEELPDYEKFKELILEKTVNNNEIN